jgi:hypothetical protein
LARAEGYCDVLIGCPVSQRGALIGLRLHRPRTDQRRLCDDGDRDESLPSYSGLLLRHHRPDGLWRAVSHGARSAQHRARTHARHPCPWPGACRFRSWLVGVLLKPQAATWTDWASEACGRLDAHVGSASLVGTGSRSCVAGDWAEPSKTMRKTKLTLGHVTDWPTSIIRPSSASSGSARSLSQSRTRVFGQMLMDVVSSRYAQR